MFSYSSMDFGKGVNIYGCSRSVNCWIRLFLLDSNIIFDVYLLWYLI